MRNAFTTYAPLVRLIDRFMTIFHFKLHIYDALKGVFDMSYARKSFTHAHLYIHNIYDFRWSIDAKSISNVVLFIPLRRVAKLCKYVVCWDRVIRNNTCLGDIWVSTPKFYEP